MVAKVQANVNINVHEKRELMRETGLEQTTELNCASNSVLNAALNWGFTREINCGVACALSRAFRGQLHAAFSPHL